MASKNLENLRKFVAPEFVFGVGARKLSGRYLDNLGIKKVLIVTDEGVKNAGWLDKITISLEERDIDYVIYDNVSPNPRDYEVADGSDIYLKNKCSGIIAIGGGSPMDAAKGIGIVSSNGGNILDYEGVDEIKTSIPPLVCVPTTSGSSADVSQFAIITDTKRKVKIAIISKAVVPDVSLIDPETATTMDKDLTAATGLDALTHAVEALVSNASSPITDINATQGIKLVFDNLLNAIANPYDIKAREGMMLASLFAGLAFSNASLGAVHAMAHALGGLLDLPHGKCNAILLPHVMRANFDSEVDKFLKIGDILNLYTINTPLSQKKEAILNKVSSLVEKAGITQTLKELKVTKEDIESLSENALNDACIVTNPRDLNKNDLKEIYESA